jgi:hypothetical protein
MAMVSVRSSCSRYASRSTRVTSLMLPTETNLERPTMPRGYAHIRKETAKAPLWVRMERPPAG